MKATTTQATTWRHHSFNRSGFSRGTCNIEIKEIPMKSGADSLRTDSAPTTCILTGTEGDNEDDCTTHQHEGQSGYSVQEPIYRTVFRVEVFSRGPYDLNVVENEFDWLTQINYDITDGPHIGQMEQVSSEVVPPETVESELVRIGNDGSFFSYDDSSVGGTSDA